MIYFTLVQFPMSRKANFTWVQIYMRKTALLQYSIFLARKLSDWLKRKHHYACLGSKKLNSGNVIFQFYWSLEIFEIKIVTKCSVNFSYEVFSINVKRCYRASRLFFHSYKATLDKFWLDASSRITSRCMYGRNPQLTSTCILPFKNIGSRNKNEN